MQFLCDVQLENETATNIPVFEESNDSSRMSSIAVVVDHVITGVALIQITLRENFDRLADSTNYSQCSSVLTPSPLADKAALFGNFIAAQFRELDSQLVDDTMLQVMQVINNAKRKN